MRYLRKTSARVAGNACAAAGIVAIFAMFAAFVLLGLGVSLWALAFAGLRTRMDAVVQILARRPAVPRRTA
jgi:hypothetical protein